MWHIVHSFETNHFEEFSFINNVRSPQGNVRIEANIMVITIFEYGWYGLIATVELCTKRTICTGLEPVMLCLI